MAPPFVRVGGLLRHGDLKGDTLKNEIPKDYIVEHITNDYSNGSNFFIVVAGTGSGKSTTLPLIFFQKYSGYSTISLQPKVETVTGMVEDFTEAKGPAFHTIGSALTNDYNLSTRYSVGKTKCKISSCLVLGSYGSFLFRLLNDPNYINEFKVIIMDEVHEDTQEVIDLLLFFYYKKKEKLPIIILTSATMNENIFDKYFDIPLTNHFEVDKQVFNKEINFEKNPVLDYKSILYDTVNKIFSEPQDNYSMLIFVASNKEIEAAKELLNESEIIKKNNIEIVGFSGEIREKKHDDYILFRENDEISDLNRRKKQIIIGTNGLETGVTIKKLKWVINIGFENNVEYIPYLNLEVFYRAPISLSSEIQRVGRVGRSFDGIAYNLYTKETHDKLSPNRYPSIITNPFINKLLKRFNRLRYIEEIPVELVYDALYNLYVLGFIDLDAKKYNIKNLYDCISYTYDTGYIIDGKLSKLGEICNEMFSTLSKYDEKESPFTINNAKFILLCNYFNFNMSEVATITAMTMSYAGESNKGTNNDFMELLKEYNRMMKDNKLINNWNVRKKIKLNETVYLKHVVLKMMYEIGLDINKEGKNSMLDNNIKTRFIIEKIFFNSYSNYVVHNKSYRGFSIKCRTDKECIIDRLKARVSSGSCEIKVNKCICIKDNSIYSQLSVF